MCTGFRVILTLILAGLGVAATVFMLAFLKAMARELRPSRIQSAERCQKTTAAQMMPSPQRQRGRAA